MTITETTSLSDRALKAKVARLAGFRSLPGCIHGSDWGWHPDRGEAPIQWANSETGELWLQKVPDYVHDLNAMHKLVVALTPEKRTEYALRLIELILPEGMEIEEIAKAVLTACARKHAEAFVLAVGDQP